MTFSNRQVELTNWSKSACSPCWFYPVRSVTEIAQVLCAARERHLPVIPHGAGHSYTDAALNSGGLVVDLKPMHRILAWDPLSGILRVEAGATLREIVRATWKDGWWPYVSPSTPDVTIGGCVAMNVNGKNAWKHGPFGAQVLSLEVMLASGEVCTLEPQRDAQLFQAIVGGLGLLGILTAVTLQLQPRASGFVHVWRQPAASLNEMFTRFAEQAASSDYLEAWLDGFASGERLGRGYLTSATLNKRGQSAPAAFSNPGGLERLEGDLVALVARLARPAWLPGVRLANRALYKSSQADHAGPGRLRSLIPFTYWPAAADRGYHAMFPHGVETFQAFLPASQAPEIFERLLRYSQEQECYPIWCILKQHRRDPFLLSYQVDGFSLELNYRRTRQNAQQLQRVIQCMIAMAIEAGGRFYLAKDHFLTAEQYRMSLGDQAVDAFLRLKQRLDADMLLQSDLFRRLLK